MQSRFNRLFALSLLVTFGWCGAVAAQPLDEASRASARTLGRAGIDAFREKNYPLATEKLERAYRVVKVPALALWSARALEKNGKLVEASERYLEATRLPVNSGDQSTQEQARADASAERESLQPRIPTLMIEVGSGVEEVHIDGVLVPVDLLGVPRPVNPGTHTVVASREGKQKTQQVTLREAEKQSLKIDLPGGPVPAKKRLSARTAHSDRSTPDDARSEHPRGGTQRIVGYTALGLGAAGVVVGAVTGGLLVSKRNANGCVDGRCPLGSEDTVNSFNTLRTASMVGFVVGAVGLGAGVTLLLTSPKQPSQTASISPWIGVGSVGVSGGF